jgi:hypothetical protein
MVSDLYRDNVWNYEIRIQNKDDSHPMYTQHKIEGTHVGYRLKDEDIANLKSQAWNEFEIILIDRQKKRKQLEAKKIDSVVLPSEARTFFYED